jgi:choline dehydrogenase-like flavoprotein
VDSPAVAELEVEAREFILAGGAIETPTLLQRSEIPDPAGWVGSRLHLHPGAVAAGVFEEDVECWKGIPQSWECTEFLDFEARGDQRAWLVGGSAHPAGMASILPGFGADYRASLKQAPRLAPISVMLHDITRGRVRAAGTHGVKIEYRLGSEDRRVMVMGLIEAGRILFAAGAREVVIPCDPPVRVRSQNELELARDQVAAALVGGRLDLVSVHPMSTVWMSEDPTQGPVSPEGRLHSAVNLRIADTSLYPTSLGVPPQITTYMAGVKVADGLLGLGR